MKRFGGILVCLITLATVGLAGPITVNNPGFETVTGATWTACGTGCQFDLTGTAGGAVFNNWTYLNAAGEFDLTVPNALFNTLSGGGSTGIVGYAGSGVAAGDIEQSVGTISTAGDTYLLTVAVGQRIGYPTIGTISLLVGGLAVNGSASSCTPTSGGWATCTYSYTTVAADVSKTLTIDLHGSTQATFDDVTLTDSVPEPSTFVFGGLGLLAVAKLARRRK